MLSETDILMRATGIGASETPMLCGVSPFGNAIDVYLRKMGLAQETATDAQLLGNFLEDGIVQLYSHKTGAACEQGSTLRHPRHSWFLATPDRLVNGRERLLEIKLVGTWMQHFWSDEENGVPEYVQVQCQQQMEVADIEWCDVAALLGGTDLRIYHLQRDREIGASLIEIAHAFWHDHVLAKVPPPLDGSDAARALLAALYPRHRTLAVDASDEANDWARKRIEAAAAVAEWERRLEFADQHLKSIMGEAEAMRGDGWSCTWKANANGTRVFRFNDKASKGRKAA